MVASLVRILDGNTFVVSDERGDIEASKTDPTGLFSYDMRYLSTWVLTINDLRLNALSTDDLQYFEARFFLVPATGTVYIDPKLSVIRQRAVGVGFHEELTILSHSAEPAELTIRVEAASDFADLFEVKDALPKLGTYDTRVDGQSLVMGYQRESFRRETTISASEPASVDEHGLTFTVTVEPHGSWTTDLNVVTSLGGLGRRATETKYGRSNRKAKPDMAQSLEDWIGEAPAPRVRLGAAQGDLPPKPRGPRGPALLAADRGRSQPAGGGPAVVHDDVRPGQHLHQPPGAAVRARSWRRRRCACWASGRAPGSDDFRDEDPGRILHEMRYGEMAAFEERPHSPYYGAVDATPLYVILLDEYERWTGDRALVRDLEDEARAAINWIDQYADLMGNGYISYKRRNERTGLENQSWKDSWNSISYADGRLPSFPRATCELQGYAYDAKIRGPAWRVSSGRTSHTRAGSRRRPPTSSAASTATSGLPTGATTPLPSTRTAARWTRSRRTTGSCCGAASSTPTRRSRWSGHLMGPRMWSGWGVRTLGRGRGPLQPGRLPPGNGLAVRQLVHRVGHAAVRVQGGGRADRVRDPRRRRGLRRPAARGVRRLRPRA